MSTQNTTIVSESYLNSTISYIKNVGSTLPAIGAIAYLAHPSSNVISVVTGGIGFVDLLTICSTEDEPL